VAERPYNQTGVKLETLYQVGQSLIDVPDDFELHKDIQKLIGSRKNALETGHGISMAFAESLAFGCLMSRFSPDHVLGLRGLSEEKR
jgi:2-oxoglutarate dehydrogenase E1 component